MQRMMDEHAIELVIQWHPDASDDIFSFTHLTLDPAADRFQLGRALMREHGARVVFFRAFSNQPHELIAVTWSNSLKQLRLLTEVLASRSEVVSAVPYVVYSGYRYETWRDRLLDPPR